MKSLVKKFLYYMLTLSTLAIGTFADEPSRAYDIDRILALAEPSTSLKSLIDISLHYQDRVSNNIICDESKLSYYYSISLVYNFHKEEIPINAWMRNEKINDFFDASEPMTSVTIIIDRISQALKSSDYREWEIRSPSTKSSFIYTELLNEISIEGFLNLICSNYHLTKIINPDSKEIYLIECDEVIRLITMNHIRFGSRLGMDMANLETPISLRESLFQLKNLSVVSKKNKTLEAEELHLTITSDGLPLIDANFAYNTYSYGINKILNKNYTSFVDLINDLNHYGIILSYQTEGTLLLLDVFTFLTQHNLIKQGGHNPFD